MELAMSTTAKETKAPPQVVVSLTVTYPAKADMTFEDFGAEQKKVQDFAKAARELGTVKGSVKIGSQKFKL
jgi:hypothetical protein